MKKNLFFAVFTALIACSCGAAKASVNSQASSPSYNQQLQAAPQQAQAAPQNPPAVTRTARAVELCYALAAEGDMRAAGTAMSFNEKVARNEAIRDARYELGRMMKVAVEGAAEDYLRNVTKDKKSTSESISEEINNQFFAETVKNSKVIKTTVYDLSDGQIQVYVCVEVQAGFDVLARAAEIAEKTLTEDEALSVEFDKERFKDKVKEGLREYKEANQK